MKKITFYIEKQNDNSVISLIKEIDEVSCRLKIDFERSFVMIENANGDIIEDIIKILKRHYKIKSIDIYNVEPKQVSTRNPHTIMTKRTEEDL